LERNGPAPVMICDAKSEEQASLRSRPSQENNVTIVDADLHRVTPCLPGIHRRLCCQRGLRVLRASSCMS
jgi:hypothetical protein